MTLSASPAARSRARERWHVLADRLRTIRPEALAKGAIGLAVAGASVALAIASWPALLPFLIGAVLAYAVLPIANRLDAFMPRVLAALLAELLAVGLLVGIVALITPPLVNALGILAQKLPSPDQVQAALANLQAQVGTLPEPMQTVARTVMSDVAANLQGAVRGVADTAGQLITDQILGILGTASNVLGLLVIPAWILTMVSDERTIKRRVGGLFPESIRPDVLALFRIVDRTLSTFLRVRVLLAIVAGVLIWVGLTVSQELGLGEYRFAMAAAVGLGALQLIPELGFFLGFFPILLVYAIGGPVAGVAATVVYVGAVKTASSLVETRVSRGVLDVHPGLLIPAIVVLSQFGTIWLFAAAPVVAIARDLVRYANSRLADPPGPANVLPGERPRRGARYAGTNARPLPSVYRKPAATPAVASPPAPPAVRGPIPAAYAAASHVARPVTTSQRSTQP